MGSIEYNHGLLWIDTPVCKGNVWNHSTYKARPVEWELGQWCHWHTCTLDDIQN